MKAAVAFLLVTLFASPEPPRQLLGKIVKGDDQAQIPGVNVKVVLDESGSQDISRDGGLFQLFLPDVLRPGDEVTISVSLSGYAIYEPPGGKSRVPADLSRTRVAIRLLPKGSPKFLSDAQLRDLVERSARESNRKRTQPSSEERPDLAHYLRDWASEYGFTIEQVRTQLNRWAADIESQRSSQYDLGLAAFAKNNFREANERALSAAAEAEANLMDLEQQKQENSERALRAYRLAGDAAYADLHFEGASDDYRKALAQTDRGRNAAQWAELQVKTANAENEVSVRSEGTAVLRHAESAIEAYGLALEIYNIDTLPEDWAMTQNNLGAALENIAERSAGPEGVSYREQEVAAYRKASRVHT